MPRLLQLPVELLHIVVSQVERSDLASLVRVNQLLKSVCLGLLYKHVVYEAPHPPSDISSYAHFVKCVDLIVSTDNFLELPTELRDVDVLRLFLRCESSDRWMVQKAANLELLNPTILIIWDVSMLERRLDARGTHRSTLHTARPSTLQHVDHIVFLSEGTPWRIIPTPFEFHYIGCLSSRLTIVLDFSLVYDDFDDFGVDDYRPTPWMWIQGFYRFFLDDDSLRTLEGAEGACLTLVIPDWVISTSSCLRALRELVDERVRDALETTSTPFEAYHERRDEDWTSARIDLRILSEWLGDAEVEPLFTAKERQRWCDMMSPQSEEVNPESLREWADISWGSESSHDAGSEDEGEDDGNVGTSDDNGDEALDPAIEAPADDALSPGAVGDHIAQ